MKMSDYDPVMLPEPDELAKEIATAMIADILETFSLEEIVQLVQEMEAEQCLFN